MSSASPTPYAGLTPERVIDAVESLGLYCDGRILALNSYENRVYRIGLDDQAPCVAKFYRPGRWSRAAILEEHQFTQELHHAELSVIPPWCFDGKTLFEQAGFRFALFPCQGGHAPDLSLPDTLRQLGRTLARLHQIGARQRFRHRQQLSIEQLGHIPLRELLASGWIKPELRPNFNRTAQALIEAIETAFDKAGEVQILRLHGDCHPGNILWRDGVAHFVDLDDSLNGPVIQDLWMFLSGPAGEQQAQLDWLLEGYGEFRDFDWRERHLIEALRSLRLLHHHAWIARRWHDPAFPPAFPWFAEPRHWENLLGQMHDQLDALHNPIFP